LIEGVVNGGLKGSYDPWVQSICKQIRDPFFFSRRTLP
jgi:hypothetical protein